MGNLQADPRRSLEDRILNNQLTSSLLQLRLVGVLLVAVLMNLRLGLQLPVEALTFYQRELLGAVRNAAAVMLSLIAGGGLVALKMQVDAEMKRHRLTAAQFFQGFPPRSRHRKR